MKTSFRAILFLLTSAMGTFSLAHAEEVVVPVGQQGADKASVARPARGMAADKVEAQFGSPLSKSAATGNPPISSWEYPEYRVFFEKDRVLHTVLKPMPTEAEINTPAPAAEAAPAAAPAPATEGAAPAPAADASPAPAAEPAAPAQGSGQLTEEVVSPPTP